MSKISDAINKEKKKGSLKGVTWSWIYRDGSILEVEEPMGHDDLAYFIDEKYNLKLEHPVYKFDYECIRVSSSMFSGILSVRTTHKDITQKQIASLRKIVRSNIDEFFGNNTFFFIYTFGQDWTCSLEDNKIFIKRYD